MKQGRPETIENRWDILYARYPDVYERFASFPYTSIGFRGLPYHFDFRGKTVVDVGGGTGKSALQFAPHAARVIAIEPEAAMREMGEAKVREHGVTNIEFVDGNCHHTTLPDSSVDIVTAITAPIDTTEALRILKPGGVIIYVDTPPGWYGGELCSVIDHATEAFEKEIARKTEGFGYFEFDSTQDYGSNANVIETYGFIFGSNAIAHLRRTGQTTITWRFRVYHRTK